MQSLIHGNFEGAAQKRVYALVGASAAIAAAVGPLVGGFITTFLSWRVGFLLELVVIAVVLLGIGTIKDVPYTGSRGIDYGGAVLSVLGMGGIVLGILAWQEGAESVGILHRGRGGVARAARLVARDDASVEGKVTLIDPDLFSSPNFRLGISGQTLQQIALGGSMIALPIFLQMVLEYNALQAGLSLAPLSLSMFFVAVLAGRRAGDRRPSTIIRGRLPPGRSSACWRLLPLVPRADSGLWLAIPLVIAGCGFGLLVSQLNNYTLAPISEERISEAAGVNSAGGSFGLSFGLAMAGGLMLATLAFTFTNMAEASTVIPPDEKAQVAAGPRRERPGHEQHPARRADREPATGGRGGDHPHQHRGAATGPPGRPAGAAVRGAARVGWCRSGWSASAISSRRRRSRAWRSTDDWRRRRTESRQPNPPYSTPEAAPNRSSSRPWRKPRSHTVSSSCPSLSMTARTMQAPGEDDVGTGRLHPDDRPSRLGIQPAEDLDLTVDLRPIEGAVVDDVRVVRREPELDRGEVRHDATHRDEAVRRRPAVDAGEVGIDRGTRLGEDVGRDGARQPEPLRVAHRADRQAEPLVDAGVDAERELRAAAARVEDGHRAFRMAVPLDGRQVGEPALLLAGDRRDRDAGPRTDGVDDLRAVARRAQSGGADRHDGDDVEGQGLARPCRRSPSPCDPAARPPMSPLVDQALAETCHDGPVDDAVPGVGRVSLADMELDGVRPDIDDRVALRLAHRGRRPRPSDSSC